MSANPYTLSFGKEPTQLISRLFSQHEILDNFAQKEPQQQVYVITGVRGVGKTVFLTEVTTRISEQGRWITVELNPNRNLLESLVAKLSSENTLAQIFQKAKINLSFFGFGLEVSGVTPITDVEVALEQMLKSIKKHGKHLLITIDEASNTKEMREFVSAFQILIRKELPVYLLVTGLYENIRELQNTKNLTFLYRAPRIDLGPLNQGAIIANYKKTFGLQDDQARQMAKLTSGYSFAFQVLGYLTWQAHGDYQSILDTYKQYLEEYVYEKIWSELSEKDRFVVRGIADAEGGKVAEVRKKLHMESNEFNPYRQRLIRKGVINGDKRGYVYFTLPFFGEFAKTAL
ncbi:ATP-binding protein [Atopobium fossor]|uniref:ATP-binding protein n=1 Tax=Atopobium fossor TaxID=39487 RepID=UPI00041277A4|nr:ATP-binding protein [Atopobium fossor]